MIAALAAVAVIVLTFPVLAAGSSDGPGECTSAVGLRTLGNSETCDTWGTAVSLPSAGLVFLLVAWGWKFLPSRGGHSQRSGPTDLDE